MKATGIVRRIDDLGRVVIPKEIRRTMRIREGYPLETVSYTHLILMLIVVVDIVSDPFCIAIVSQEMCNVNNNLRSYHNRISSRFSALFQMLLSAIAESSSAGTAVYPFNGYTCSNVYSCLLYTSRCV